jgi:hypothetical protein
VTPVRHKLAFVHDIVTRAPLSPGEQYTLAMAGAGAGETETS